jgi:hypothetical protein
MFKSIAGDSSATMRAGAIALVATAIQEGFTLEQVLSRAEELGLNPEQPHLKQFIVEHYTSPLASG